VPHQRAKHKRHLQGWIDEKVYTAFIRKQRADGCTAAELLERLLAKSLKTKPSGKVAAKAGMPSGSERLKHGAWRRTATK
jgi:hypothetical protein